MNEVGKMTYYAIDFETANDYPNSACSVGVVRFVDGIEYDAHNALDDARTCGKIFTLAAEESNTSLEDLFSNNIFCHFTSTE